MGRTVWTGHSIECTIHCRSQARDHGVSTYPLAAFVLYLQAQCMCPSTECSKAILRRSRRSMYRPARQPHRQNMTTKESLSDVRSKSPADEVLEAYPAHRYD